MFALKCISQDKLPSLVFLDVLFIPDNMQAWEPNTLSITKVNEYEYMIIHRHGSCFITSEEMVARVTICGRNTRHDPKMHTDLKTNCVNGKSSVQD